jgi:hypothetical protein
MKVARVILFSSMVGIFLVVALTPRTPSAVKSPTPIEVEARGFIRGESPYQSAAEKNVAAATRMLSGRYNVPEERTRSLSPSSQSLLAGQYLSETLGVSREDLMRMGPDERRERTIQHLARKYGRSVEETRRA